MIRVMPAAQIAIIIVVGLYLTAAILDRRGKLDKYNVQRISFLGLIWRTERGKHLIDKIAARARRFWDVFGWVGLGVSILGVGGIFFFLVWGMKLMMQAPQPTPTVMPLLPGIEIGGLPFFIPFSYGILSIIVIVAAHEFGHAVIARIEGISLKSAGLGLVLILPLAFVEPDEEEEKEARRTQRLRLYAVGSFANFLVAGVCFLALFSLFTPAGLQIRQVYPDTPAQNVLSEGMVIIGVNNRETLSFVAFEREMAKVVPGEKVTLQFKNGSQTVSTFPNPKNESEALIGVQLQQRHILPYLGIKLPNFLVQAFIWLFILNLGVGAVNLLPIPPLDGGKMMDEMVGWITKKIGAPEKAEIITDTVSFIALFLLLINFFGPFIL